MDCVLLVWDESKREVVGRIVFLFNCCHSFVCTSVGVRFSFLITQKSTSSKSVSVQSFSFDSVDL